MNYNKIYDALISRSVNRTIDGYVERHHIVPRCMDGGDNKENIAILTPEEHFLAHQLLVKIYPDNPGLVYALARLSAGKSQIRNNKLYGWIKRRLAEVRSDAMLGNNIWLGRKHSDASKKKISTSLKNRKGKGIEKSDKGKPNPNKSHLHTDESKLKISQSKSNIPKSKIECPHCGKLSAPHLAYRYHFNSCKKINTFNSP